MNEKISEENRILMYLKKNKHKNEKLFLDEKIKVVSDQLKFKNQLILSLLSVFNLNMLIEFITLMVENSNKQNLKNFIFKRSQKIINSHIYSYYVV